MRSSKYFFLSLRLSAPVVDMEIEEGADDCISTASVSLTNKEKLLLRNVAPGPCG